MFLYGRLFNVPKITVSIFIILTVFCLKKFKSKPNAVSFLRRNITSCVSVPLLFFSTFFEIWYILSLCLAVKFLVVVYQIEGCASSLYVSYLHWIQCTQCEGNVKNYLGFFFWTKLGLLLKLNYILCIYPSVPWLLVNLRYFFEIRYMDWCYQYGQKYGFWWLYLN